MASPRMAHLSRHLDRASAVPGAEGEALDRRRRVARRGTRGSSTASRRPRWTPSPRRRRCAPRAIADGGLVHLFGTGHSRIPLEEMFPRYGSYPGFHPIAELSMTFHTQVAGANGQRQAMFIERTEGLAEVILANFQFGPSDVMLVFSASRADGRADRDGDRRPGPRPAVGGGHLGRPVDGRPPDHPTGPGCSTTRTSSSTCARRPAMRSSVSTGWTRRSARARRSPTPRSSTRSRSRRRRSCSSRGRCHRS